MPRSYSCIGPAPETIDLATADSVVSDLMPLLRVATRTSSVRRRGSEGHRMGARRQDVIENGLRDAGLDVEGVASPADALASCTRRMPSVVVTAYRAKGMSGAKIARAIHLVDEHEAPPVILLLAPDDVATGDLSAVSCVAAQSLAPDKLAELVRELL